jgi:HlyD family secretion protein
MSMQPGKKPWIILAVLIIAALAGGYVYHQRQERARAASGQITLYGNIDIREADLAFNVGGRIEHMLVEEGDRVKPGQLLAQLDASTYQAEVAAAEATAAAQQSVLDRLLAGSRSQEIKMAAADVKSVEAELADARSTLRRTKKLTLSDFATKQKLDNDRSRVAMLEAKLKAAEQALSLAIEGPRNEDIAQARAQLKARRAAVRLARQRLDYTELHARGAGIIKTRVVEPGAVVGPQTPVYTVALSDPVWVRTYVSEPDLGRVVPGMAARVFTDSELGSETGRVHEGWVGFISPVAEFTPKTVETREVRTSLVYRLRVYVKNPDNSLRQGMPVTVRLIPAPSPE